MIKSLLANAGDMRHLIQSLGWENPLEEEMVIYYSILAWRIRCTEKHDELQSMGSQRNGHD